MARAICTGGAYGGCGRCFASVTDFDTHRVGAFARGGQRPPSRRCMTEAEMMTSGLTVHPAKTHQQMPLWVSALSLDRIETLRAAFGQPKPENGQQSA